MPKSTILEKDLTSSGQQSSDDFVVLIPGVYSELLWKEDVKREPVLISNSSTASSAITFDQFKQLIFAKAEESGIDPDIKKYIEESYGFKETEKLVDLGMTVLYGIIKLDDGRIEESGYDPVYKALSDDFYDLYTDRSLFDIRFITLGGEVDKAIAEKAIHCAATRGDAIALIDLPEKFQNGTTTLELNKAPDIQEYLSLLQVESIERKFADGETDKEDPFTYGCAFAPKFSYVTGGEYDENGAYHIVREEELGSFAYLSAFADHINRFPEWYATAGSVRGVLPFLNVSPVTKFGMNAINEYLTTRDGRKRACNPICEDKPYGNILYGNRTLYATPATDVAKYGIGLRASHFLNIRQLCCTLKKVLYRASRRFTFEPNTDVVWVNFCEAIRPTLDYMKANQGIRGYSIERQSTSVKGVLKAKITIVPIEALEDFDLTIELADSVEISE